MHRSLSARVAGLRAGQVVRIRETSDGIEVSGCNPVAEQIVMDGLQYTASGRLMVRPDSLAVRSGAQFRIRSR